jgi:hypothetical protein
MDPPSGCSYSAGKNELLMVVSDYYQPPHQIRLQLVEKLLLKMTRKPLKVDYVEELLLLGEIRSKAVYSSLE